MTVSTAVPSSESTPLLPSCEGQTRDAPYNRFTPAKKRLIVALCAGVGFMPFLVADSFVPAIPLIVDDLNSTPTTVALAVSLSLFSNAIGNLWWATYSGFYGRRPIYLVSLLILCIASLGVASSRSVPSLLIWRVIQAFGCSPGLSVGPAVIGDMYKLEERGTVMGVFFGAVLLGPAVAPSLGGAASDLASWRAVPLCLCALGAVLLVLMFWYLPETAHPGSRGVDRMLNAERAALGTSDGAADNVRWRWVWLNPFNCLALLRAPNLLAVTVGGTLVLLTDFILGIPMAYTLGKRYNLESAALVGLLFIPSGIGSFIGAPLAGRLSDRAIVRGRAKRQGEWVPEDRLRAALVSAGLLAPLSIILSGLITRYVSRHVGLGLNIVALFVNGLAVDMTLTPSAAYCIDVLQSHSAEVTSSTNALRSAILASFSAGVVPAVETFGLVFTNTCGAILAWIGFALLLCTIRYGHRMRAWTNIEWSTPLDN